MDKIIRDVREIDRADRQALGHVIGQSLRENQQVIINVLNIEVSSPCGEEPASEEPARAEEPASEEPASEDTGPSAEQPDDRIPEWWKVYEGLSDEEIDRLDTAIRERANLSRQFE